MEFTPDEQKALRVSLLKEEVKGLEEALKKDDLVEAADALTDIMYVLAGAYLTFGLQEDAVALAMRKPDDFVLERGAVAGPHSLNLAVEERGLVDVGEDDLVDAVGGVYLPAHHLRPHEPVRHERQGHGLIISGLEPERPGAHGGVEVDVGGEGTMTLSAMRRTRSRSCVTTTEVSFKCFLSLFIKPIRTSDMMGSTMVVGSS